MIGVHGACQFIAPPQLWLSFSPHRPRSSVTSHPSLLLQSYNFPTSNDFSAIFLHLTVRTRHHAWKVGRRAGPSALAERYCRYGYQASLLGRSDFEHGTWLYQRVLSVSKPTDHHHDGRFCCCDYPPQLVSPLLPFLKFTSLVLWFYSRTSWSLWSPLLLSAFQSFPAVPA